MIRVGKKDKDGNTIRDVMVYDHTKHKGNIAVTTAEWGKMELTPDKRFLVFRLYNGINYEERVDLRKNEITRPFQRTTFKEQYQTFDLSALQLTRTDENLFKKNYEMQNIVQLSKSIDSLKRDFNREKVVYNRALSDRYPAYRQAIAGEDNEDRPPPLADPPNSRTAFYLILTGKNGPRSCRQPPSAPKQQKKPSG